MSIKMLKPIAESFDNDGQRWLDLLKELGFDFEVINVDGFMKAFSQLKMARSFDLESPPENSITYLDKASKKFNFLAPWSIVVLDRSASLDLSQFSQPLLLTTCAAAAVDTLQKAQWPADYAAESVSANTSPPNTSPRNSYTKVKIEDNVFIGPDVEIGEGTVIEFASRIGAGVKIGKNCRIGAHSRIADYCVIGNECDFTSHVSIGGQGFGFVKYPQKKSPQPRRHLGRVIVGDRVRLGAFVAIDRGVFEDTFVGNGTAIDNIVQIAHNCRVGENNVLCSFVGLSGTTVLGDRVTIAGMVGTKGHVNVGDDVTIAAQSGVSKDIAPGQVVKGYPTKPLSEALEIQTLISKLPQIVLRIKKLESENK